MRRRSLVLLAACWLTAAEPTLAADAKEGPDLRGTWTAVSAERDGKAADDLKGHRLTLGGGRFTIRSGDKVLYRGTYTLDPSDKPPALDFRHAEGALKGKTWRGIYRLEGDTLKVCDNAGDLGKGRPGEFATKPGSGRVLVTFKRAGP